MLPIRVAFFVLKFSQTIICVFVMNKSLPKWSVVQEWFQLFPFSKNHLATDAKILISIERNFICVSVANKTGKTTLTLRCYTI